VERAVGSHALLYLNAIALAATVLRGSLIFALSVIFVVMNFTSIVAVVSGAEYPLQL